MKERLDYFEPSFREVANACYIQAAESVRELEQLHLSGELDQEHSEIGAQIALELADIVLAEGDESEALRWYDRAAQFVEEDNPAWTIAHFRAVELGSVRAAEILHDTLHQERENTLNGNLAVPSPRIGPYQDTPQSHIMQIVEQCAARGLPATKWIDQYGLNRVHIFGLNVHYAHQILAYEQESLSFLQETRDAIINTLLDDEALPPAVIFIETENVLRQVSDLEVRLRVMERFEEIKSFGATPKSIIHLFKSYISLAEYILDSPDLASADRIARHEKHMKAIADSMASHGLHQALLSVLQVNWHVKLAHFHGAPPEMLIAKVDEVSRDILNLPDQERRLIDDDVFERDALLATWAVYFAEKSDFAAAALFLKNVADEARQCETLRDCLQYAQSYGAARLLEPDSLQMLFNPDLATEADIARAALSANPQTIHDALGAVLQAKKVTYAHIEQLLAALPDTEAGWAVFQTVRPKIVNRLSEATDSDFVQHEKLLQQVMTPGVCLHLLQNDQTASPTSRASRALVLSKVVSQKIDH